jgi:probable rRNA maturation factor
VQYAVARRGLPGAAALRRWASVFSFGKVVLRLVSEKEGRQLNRQFRGMKKATNVLAFGTGDIVLCHPVIAREARAQGKSLRAHYAHLVVHGVLHLRGYDHGTKAQAQRMEAREVRLLARLGFGDPYALK